MPVQTINNDPYASNGQKQHTPLVEIYPDLLVGNAVSEIVNAQPSFLIRWGISVFFLVLIMAVSATWLIQYPDIVTARAKLISIDAPKEIKTKITGKLSKLLIKEDQFVTSGTLIGCMESVADMTEIAELARTLRDLENAILADNHSTVIHYLQHNFGHLGELQQANQTFTEQLLQYSNYLDNGFYVKKKLLLNHDVDFLKRQLNLLKQQEALQYKDLALSQQNILASTSLVQDSVISALEFRNEQSKHLGKLSSVPQIELTIIANESQQNEKQKEIMELGNQILQQKTVILQELHTFQHKISEWEQTYLLKVPIDGKIMFATFLQEDQQLQANQTICYVHPDDTKYFVEMHVPQSNFGKIEPGQEVLLKFPAYPYQEFGSVSGEIDFIARVPTDSGYLSRVILPMGLTTNYQKQVPFREGLTIQGEIVTKNIRLLERFYFNFRKI
jgi:multidrug efflux pump subunit AcrA (membrane-fusion protein)